MKYTAKVTEKAIQRIVDDEKIVLSHDEYDNLVKIFAQSKDWHDLQGVHVNQITLHGGYKNFPESITLQVEVQ